MQSSTSGHLYMITKILFLQWPSQAQAGLPHFFQIKAHGINLSSLGSQVEQPGR